MLLLWMSILVLTPFDMKRFDSGAKEDTITERILRTIKKHLASSNRSQDAAAFLAAKFLTRPEIVAQHLDDFLGYCTGFACDSRKDDVAKMGCLRALGSIFKQGKRSDLIGSAKNTLALVVEQNFKHSPNSLLRKLSFKLVQRLGLTFLKSRIAPWRYQRGSRSLAINLQPQKAAQEPSPKKGVDADDDEGYEIPDEIEDVIEELLLGLRDKDTQRYVFK